MEPVGHVEAYSRQRAASLCDHKTDMLFLYQFRIPVIHHISCHKYRTKVAWAKGFHLAEYPVKRISDTVKRNGAVYHDFRDQQVVGNSGRHCFFELVCK